MPELAVEVRELQKIYASNRGDRIALRGIDLAVPAGSIFGLLGPNGAGKSTFINVLAGTVVKNSGTVRIWGFDQDENPRMSRAAIGVVPQELNIDPFFTPEHSLEIQAGLYGVPKARRRTREILDATGLTEQRKLYARALSGGMRRRLLVAKAMVHNPPVLVLDEPTAGVDVALRADLWSFVRSLNRTGSTVILTTHYLEEAEAMCDRIAIIDRGRVIAEDETDGLVNRIDSKTMIIVPETPITAVPKGLAAAVPEARISLRHDGALVATYSRRRLRAGRMLEAIAQAGVAIADVTTREPHLQDVFLALTGGGTEGRNSSNAA